jgi:Family of unknown function (DUF6455)
MASLSGNIVAALGLAIVGVLMVYAIAVGWCDMASDGGHGLLARMMRRCGIDPSALEGSVSGQDYVGARRTCALCDRKVECRDWLYFSQTPAFSSFCPNSELLARLKDFRR